MYKAVFDRKTQPIIIITQGPQKYYGFVQNYTLAGGTCDMILQHNGIPEL